MNHLERSKKIYKSIVLLLLVYNEIAPTYALKKIRELEGFINQVRSSKQFQDMFQSCKLFWARVEGVCYIQKANPV
jgi:hypothetical protein